MILIIRGEVVQTGAGIQGIVIVIRLGGRQSGLNAQQTGVTNGGGGQSFVLIGVVGTIQIFVDDIGLTALGVNDCGIDIQVGERGWLVQAVIDDRRDVVVFATAGTFLFNHGGHNHNLVKRVFVSFQIDFQFVCKDLIKATQETAEYTLGRIADIEVVGIREKETLQRIFYILVGVFQEPIITLDLVSFQFRGGADTFSSRRAKIWAQV
jgi:hypothetical protein